LLAGIIVIGIGIGLFATSITAILLASSAAQAADPTGGCALPTRRRRMWWAFNPTNSPKLVGSDTETFTTQDGTMNSDTPSRGSRGSSIEDTDDKEGIAGAAHDRLAEDVSAYCSGTATGDAGL
jgi:hypothetical protein